MEKIDLGEAKPSMILKQKGMKNSYETYENPSDTVIEDIKALTADLRKYSTDFDHHLQRDY